jgi:hypothetical protein
MVEDVANNCTIRQGYLGVPLTGQLSQGGIQPNYRDVRRRLHLPLDDLQGL